MHVHDRTAIVGWQQPQQCVEPQLLHLLAAASAERILRPTHSQAAPISLRARQPPGIRAVSALRLPMPRTTDPTQPRR